ncbi:helix-turn-helix domain-containing protein [Cryptosporangium arvum]|uniref:Putative transcriptional regulator n=1 Tax=Cryptosporangium arvum DSM 44712 TaxID=927661 RepID=A0A010YXV1_9ACTN|nr:helix-turn-helix transcriptional regulator [Cryptosporangium arvum]EXG80033.1 putative transcriptional regulator [Cryptosporangium arvum DSM 44712]
MTPVVRLRQAADPAETFGQALARWRQSRGLSLRRFADLVHYSSSYLHELERGRKTGSLALARKLDDALDAGGELVALAPEQKPPMLPAALSGRPTVRPVAGRDGWMVLQVGDAVLVLEPAEVDALREQLNV